MLHHRMVILSWILLGATVLYSTQPRHLTLVPTEHRTSSSPASVIFWVGCYEQHRIHYSVGGTALCQGPCYDLSLLSLRLLELSTAHCWGVQESLDGGTPLNLFERLFTFVIKIELYHIAPSLSSLQSLPGLLLLTPSRSISNP
jgi:hypothetical protein